MKSQIAVENYLQTVRMKCSLMVKTIIFIIKLIDCMCIVEHPTMIVFIHIKLLDQALFTDGNSYFLYSH